MSPEPQPIVQRESGGYYYADPKTGKQVSVNSPNKHGNTLNDTPAECYGLHCRDTGKLKKLGETTHGEVAYGPGKQKRYTRKYLREKKVEYKQRATGTKKGMYDLQRKELEAYKQKHGRYPELNKNGR